MNLMGVAIAIGISSAFFGTVLAFGGGGPVTTGRIEMEDGLGDLLMTEDGDFMLLE